MARLSDSLPPEGKVSPFISQPRQAAMRFRVPWSLPGLLTICYASSAWGSVTVSSRVPPVNIKNDGF